MDVINSIVSKLSNVTIPSSWVDWCGVFAFILSFVLALNELAKHRTRLSISEAEFYPMHADDEDVYFFIRCMITNGSNAPISITNFCLRITDGASCTPMRGEHSIMSATLTSTKTGESKRSEYLNTPLPFNLNPYESKETCLVFHPQLSEIPEFLRPSSANNRPVSESKSQNLHLQASLSTSRHPVSCSFDAAVCNCKTLMKELRKRNSLKL